MLKQLFYLFIFFFMIEIVACNIVTIKDIKDFFVIIWSLHMIANVQLTKADSFDDGAFHGKCIPRFCTIAFWILDFSNRERPVISIRVSC
jgi:hypothetical protein